MILDLPEQQLDCKFKDGGLTLNALGIFEKTVGKLQIMVKPPLGSSLSISGVYVKTAAKTLINSLVPLLHVAHEQFLLGRWLITPSSLRERALRCDEARGHERDCP